MSLMFFIKSYALIYFLILYNVVNLVEPYIPRTDLKFGMMADSIFKTMLKSQFFFVTLFLSFLSCKS